MKMDKAIKRGDLVYLNFDPIVGSSRAVRVRRLWFRMTWGISMHRRLSLHRSQVKNKKSNLPTHVKLTSHILERNSMVLLEQLKTVDKSRIDSYIGTLSDEEMKMIDKALRISLAIGRYKKRSV